MSNHGGLDFSWNRRAIPQLRGGASRNEIVRNLAQNLVGFVWNTAALEGNSFTVHGVQSLIDGVHVTGHPISDVHQIEDITEAYTRLLDQARTDSLDWDRETSDHSNGILARHEALVAGQFRTSEVSVHLGARGAYTPPPAVDLDDHYRAGISALDNIERPDERALAYFAFGARSQFYFDGNKRTSRHIMNAILMSAGHHPIVVPVARALEFDEACVSMFADADATDIMRFLASCTA